MNAAQKAALTKLSREFKATEVKQRTQGGKQLDYIDIATTINRFNEVLGVDWAQHVDRVEVTPLDGGRFLAVVAVTVSALGSERSGVGADVASDPDKAVKTALAEAFKKAGHGFGVGLYLWDEDARNELAQLRQTADPDLNQLKNAVARRYQAEAHVTELVPANLAAHFGINLTELQDVRVLQAILDRPQLEAA